MRPRISPASDTLEVHNWRGGLCQRPVSFFRRMLREMFSPHVVLSGSKEIELNGMAISLNHPSPVTRLLHSQIASQLPPV